MKYSRRDLGFLLPALAAARASAQSASSSEGRAPSAAPQADNSVEKLPVLKTKDYKYDELPVATNGKNKQRRCFTAKTHTGFKMESHMSDIWPGEVNHPPHQHLREEMMLVREGVMELTISGVPHRLGPGDIGVIGSNEIHNAKNVGNTVAKYFIVNIGRDDV
ncbi:MAG TPA: cupin domain-containing protein [Bryobacteraceae bacterium]|jgi:mannose-6-phosphate isomerase-like protein (cupin superfamily)